MHAHTIVNGKTNERFISIKDLCLWLLQHEDVGGPEIKHFIKYMQRILLEIAYK